MQQYSFYNYHLEAISRSFSFCIAQLNSPSREWVALSYLLLRIADTIEDSNWNSTKAQFEVFQEFKTYIRYPPAEKQLDKWFAKFPQDLLTSEKNLLSDTFLLLMDMNQLPEEIKKPLITTISTMIEGMIYFISNHKKDNIFSLPSIKKTNQYCFFVAGIVGELLSHIFAYTLTKFELRHEVLNQSLHFGLFLQKINILKDQVKDELAGRFYTSSRSEIYDSLSTHAHYALDYIKVIPIVSGRRYRLFCSWSLFIGLASLKWIEKGWNNNCQYKIGRRETTHILNQIKERIDDNVALENLFKCYIGERKPLYPSGRHEGLPKWFIKLYGENCSKIDCIALDL